MITRPGAAYLSSYPRWSVSIAVDSDWHNSVVFSALIVRHYALPEAVTVYNSVAHCFTSEPVVILTTSGSFTCSFTLDVGHTIDADVIPKKRLLCLL